MEEKDNIELKDEIIHLSNRNNLSLEIGNLSQGEAVVLDIDGTILHNAVDKYGKLKPKPTERDIKRLLDFLKETGHRVILLTARKE